MLVCEFPPVLPPPRATIPSFMRTHSGLRATFGRAAARTGVLELREAGALRLRFPRVGGACEGIIVNTSGGIAGGDGQDLNFELGPDAEVALTTQSAEKVYRSDGEIASVATRLRVAAGARLAWLPQEAILSDGARLSRRLDADIDPAATLTVKEGVVFGRTARPERMTHGLFHDHWRIRRGGRLILAEAVRLEGDIAATLDCAATGAGAAAMATIVQVAPDAEGRRDAVRGVLAALPCEAAASAWNGMLVARFADRDPHRVRAATAAVLSVLLPHVSQRIWSC